MLHPPMRTSVQLNSVGNDLYYCACSSELSKCCTRLCTLIPVRYKTQTKSLYRTRDFCLDKFLLTRIANTATETDECSFQEIKKKMFQNILHYYICIVTDRI